MAALYNILNSMNKCPFDISKLSLEVGKSKKLKYNDVEYIIYKD